MFGSWDDDRDPLTALAQGDSTLFESFVEAEAASLVGFFQRQGASTADAEDLAQDVFVKLYQTAHNYQPRERFAAFCLRIARNAWIDRIRRSAVRPKPATGIGPASESASGPKLGTGGGTTSKNREVIAAGAERSAPDTALQSEASEEARRLHRALSRLSEHHRMAFELGVLQQLAYSEVSELMGIPVGTVKSRIFHAIRQLRTALQCTEAATEENRARPHAGPHASNPVASKPESRGPATDGDATGGGAKR